MLPRWASSHYSFFLYFFSFDTHRWMTQTLLLFLLPLPVLFFLVRVASFHRRTPHVLKKGKRNVKAAASRWTHCSTIDKTKTNTVVSMAKQKKMENKRGDKKMERVRWKDSVEQKKRELKHIISVSTRAESANNQQHANKKKENRKGVCEELRGNKKKDSVYVCVVTTTRALAYWIKKKRGKKNRWKK